MSGARDIYPKAIALDMDAVVKWVDGLNFLGRAGEKDWVRLEASPQFGGSGRSLTPMELVLVGLGGCTGMDVVSILEKSKVRLKGFRVELHADKGDEHPKVFTRIRVKYVLVGKGIPPGKVEKAIQLSRERYCSVSAMLKGTAKIEHSYEIKEE